MKQDAALSPFGVKTVGPTVADLPPAALDYLSQHGTLRDYRKGDEVQRQQVAPSAASWLQSGRLRSVIYLSDGSVHIGGWVLPSELFGVFNTLLQGGPSTVTMLVDTAQARVLHFSRDVLLDMMRSFPQARVGIALGLSRRILQLHDVIDVSGPRPLADKLRAVLAWWTHQYATPARDGSVELWLSQVDLAQAVGASRQRVHVELKALQASGEVDLGYRKIIVRPCFFERLRLFED